MTADSTAETKALRESMLGYVTTRPRSAERIFSLLRDEWGDVNERRLWRTLRWLVSTGAVTRLGVSRSGSSYIRGAVCATCGGSGYEVAA